MTRAAEALHVAQSAVSRQIALLESELGVPLFERSGRNIRLTEYGKIFLTYAERGIQAFGKAKLKISERLEGESGLVRIGLSDGLSLPALPSLLHAFRKIRTGIDVRFRQSDLPDLIQMVGDGRLDLAIVAPMPRHRRAIVSTPLFTERMVLLASKHHRLSGQKNIRLDQLSRERLIVIDGSAASRKAFGETCRRAGFEPNIVFEGKDCGMIGSLVASDFGLAVVPEHAAAGCRLPDMTAVPIAAPALSRAVGFIRSENHELRPLAALFIRLLLDRFRRPDPSGT